MSVPWSSKKECRSYYKSLCAREFAQGLVQNQQQLNSHLQAYFSRQTGVWAAYRALPEEAQVEEVFAIPHLSWVFPRMRDDRLEFFEALSFVSGPYGVREPSLGSALTNLSAIDGVLIPGMVFNKNGNRLGKGKGFYDKTLSAYQGVKVGVCFDFQISSSVLPLEPHDVKVDYLLTESGWIDCRQHQE